ncbi:hypothetical protein, partial [Nocardia abscessus]|uniref:hypothetical protein n=1 Tax=Nocardia abscessus TaxID=120957 RepID=UPI002457BA1F
PPAPPPPAGPLLPPVWAAAPPAPPGAGGPFYHRAGCGDWRGATPRHDDTPFLAIKVDDLDIVLNRLRTNGFEAQPPVTGPHERRAVLRPAPGCAWHVSLYESRTPGPAPTEPAQ